MELCPNCIRKVEQDITALIRVDKAKHLRNRDPKEWVDAFEELIGRGNKRPITNRVIQTKARGGPGEYGGDFAEKAGFALFGVRKGNGVPAYTYLNRN